jgi:UPF0755 protein
MDNHQQDADKLQNKSSYSDDTYDSIIAEIRASLGQEESSVSQTSATLLSEDPNKENSSEGEASSDTNSVPQETSQTSAEPDALAEEPTVVMDAAQQTAGDTNDSLPQKEAPLEDAKKQDDASKGSEEASPVPAKASRIQVHVSEEDLNRPVFDSEHPAWSESDRTPPVMREEEQPQKKKRKKRRGPSCLGWAFRLVLVVSLVAVLAVGCMGVVYAVGDMLGLTEDDSNITLTIEPNTSIQDVTSMLKENGIIKYPVVFRLYLRYVLHNDVNFNYGLFTLQPSMSYEEIVAELEQTTESNDQVTLTFPEGYDVVDIAEKLQDNSVCTKADFIDAINNNTYDYDFLESCYENRDSKAYVLEGYLFPDTYVFTENQDVDAVVRTFLDNFDRKFTDTMRTRCINSGRSIDDVVTLASIIESEAPVKIEMARVSSVLLNRLDNPESFPKLQCDPTSKYADDVLAAQGFDQSMTDTYDTYVCEGLPAGAINNPGINALKAALYPSQTDYYFYCSNLSTGEFYYASTYEQHQNNLALAGLTE